MFVPAHSAAREVHLEVQGELIALAKKSEAVQKRPVGIKQPMTVFSRSSRRRLLNTLARLQADDCTFITLTYPSTFPNAETAKANLRAFLERIRRRFPMASGIWRLDYQDRGAPHFHLVMFNLPFIHKNVLQRWWAECIGLWNENRTPFTRIEFVRGRRAVFNYVAKYAAKVSEEGVGSGGFNAVSLLHAGRYWGKFNSGWLPYAVKIYAVLRGVDLRDFHTVKSYFRQYWSNFNKKRWQGGTMRGKHSPGLFAGSLQTLLGQSSTYIEIVSLTTG